MPRGNGGSSVSAAVYRSRLIYDEIPGAPGAHGSTVCELADGRLMAAWYAGSYEGHPDVAIYGAYLLPGADCWSTPFVLEKTLGLSEGNPVLHPWPDGTVTLFWVTMHGRGWSTCRIRIRDSASAGGERRWGPERSFAEDLGYMTRHKPLVMSNGELLLPLYDERAWASFCAWSKDGGKTWQRGDLIVSEPCNIQPTVVETRPGKLIALLRHGGKDGFLWRTTSKDYGRTWSDPEPTGVANPNSGADMVMLPSGAIAIALNDSPRARTPLTLGLSIDEARTFPYRRNVESAPGEYSYPALIVDRDGCLQLTYTYRRETIKHVTTNEAWIRSG